MKWAHLVTSVTAVSFLLCATAMGETDPKTVRVWIGKCASCHGQTGKADTQKGQELKLEDMTTPAFKAKKDAELKDAILNGVKVERGGTTVVMDPYKNEITPEQADALVAYVRTFAAHVHKAKKSAKKKSIPDAGVSAPAPSPER